jgi:hypothetical protein
MLSRRSAILFSTVSVLLLGTAAATVVIFQLPDQKLNIGSSLGTVRFASPFLEQAGTRIDLKSTSTEKIETAYFRWRDPELQGLFGSIRITAHSTDAPPRAWSRIGSVCGYLLEQYGDPDGVIAIPGLTTLSYQNMHICQTLSQDRHRQWLYVFALPISRCRNKALVFARIPWMYLDPGEKRAAENSEIEAQKAKVFNVLGPTKVALDSECQQTMRTFAWYMMVVPGALLVGAGGLLRGLWRRSRPRPRQR